MVSKRVGNAVVRNRIKRRLRESVRSRQVESGWDAVFIARRGVRRATYSELDRAAWNLLRRSRMVAAERTRDVSGTANDGVSGSGGESS